MNAIVTVGLAVDWAATLISLTCEPSLTCMQGSGPNGVRVRLFSKGFRSRVPGKGVIGSTSPRLMTDTEWDTGSKRRVMPLAQPQQVVMQHNLWNARSCLSYYTETTLTLERDAIILQVDGPLNHPPKQRQAGTEHEAEAMEVQQRAAQAATKHQKSLNMQLVDASSPEGILEIVARFEDANSVNVTTAFHRLCRVSSCLPLQLSACVNLLPGKVTPNKHTFDQSSACPAVLLWH